jgi:hypothetical protein
VSRPKHAAQRPATFGDVFAVREYRVLYAASALSWAGDYLARAAVSALVYRATGSAALSAGTLAVGYLPWLTIGPFLSALAERYSKRAVMVTCDVVRGCVIGIVAIPGLSTPLLFTLLFVAALLNPPFESARAALLPSILTGDRYVVGVSLQTTTTTAAMITGYFIGGVVGARYPHVTLLADAITFIGSALLVGLGIKSRPVSRTETRTTLVRETGAGFHLVFTNPVLRSIAVIVLGVSLLGIVPEGLAAAWAGHFTHNVDQRGLDQALIMISVPIGLILGGAVAGRLINPATRRRLIRPFAIVVPLALTAALADPSVLGVAAIGLVVGFAVSSILVPSNGLYVQSLPASFRARAFGVIQFGIQFVQVGALVGTGLLSDRFAIHDVVGIWGLFGIGLMIAVATTWPKPAAIDAAIAAATVANEAAEIAARDGSPANRPVTPTVARPAPRAPRARGHSAGAATETPIGPVPDPQR